MAAVMCMLTNAAISARCAWTAAVTRASSRASRFAETWLSMLAMRRRALDCTSRTFCGLRAERRGARGQWRRPDPDPEPGGGGGQRVTG